MKKTSMQFRLTSRELKVKQKSANIAGLQLADILASPCFRWALERKEKLPASTDFGGVVAAVAEAVKFRRGPNGTIDGYGLKWLP